MTRTITRTGLTMIALLAASGLTALSPAAAQESAAPVEDAAHAQTAGSADLTITFTNLAEPKGTIMLALFDSQQSYDGGSEPVRAMAIEVTSGTVTATITDLPHGSYGFKLVHDINGDGQMNVNPFGMPLEPFAFSNNAPANMGPARWDAAAFDVSGPTTQTIAF